MSAHFSRRDERLVEPLSPAVTDAIELAKREPDQMRQLIDPRNPQSSEYETVIAGLMAIRLFLYHLGVHEFIVSGLGTRYGLAALIGRNIKLPG